MRLHSILFILAVALCLAPVVSARLHSRHHRLPAAADSAAREARARPTAPSTVRGGPAVDSSGWVGAEYTPARASNELWWWTFDEYEDDVRFELAVAAQKFGFTAVRMFLHSLLYEGDKAKLIKNMDTFMDICAQNGIKAGFVFFDDCWNAAGADLSAPCQPVKGRHNGCWMQSPQAVDRTTVDRYRPYVTDVIAAFRNDSRVLFWELFNEPGDSNFTAQLKDSAMQWAYALHPVAPIISCWDDNKYSNLVDVHRYTSDFVDTAQDVFQSPAKGGVITEAGARWTAGGSVKEYVNFLTAVSKDLYTYPFVPGIFTQWELLLGNSNTRWHWSSPDNAPEPTLGFHGHFFPDGTPVSYTEMSLLKRHVRAMHGQSYEPFTYVNTFLDAVATLQQNQVLDLPTPATYNLTDAHTTMSDGVYEVSLAPHNSASAIGLLLFARDAGATGLLVNVQSTGLVLQQRNGTSPVVLATFNASAIECGVATDSTDPGYWNVLRVVVRGSAVSVFFNTMHSDVPTRNSTLAPRLQLTLPDSLTPSGGLAVVSSGNGGGRVDYVSVQPLSVL